MNKACSKCKTEYPATKEFFYSAKRNKDGLQSMCKNCANADRKKYYQENKERLLAYAKKYYKDNKGYISDREKKYKEENKEKINAKRRKYRQENKDRISARNKKYRQENKEWLLEYYKKYSKEKTEMLRPSYVADCMGMSVEDLTPEIYETKKLIIQLKRETR